MTAKTDNSMQKMIIAILGLGVLAIFLTSFVMGVNVPTAKERAASSSEGSDIMASVAPLMAKLKDNPDDKEAVSKLAHIFTKAENWEKALPFWAKLVVLDPKNVGTRYHYGFALSQLNSFPEAVGQYEAILKADPKEHAAHYYLGMINRYGLKKMDVAQKHFQLALDGNPDDRELVAEIKKELGSMK